MQDQKPEQKNPNAPTTVEEVVVNGFSWQVKPEKPKKFDPNDLGTLPDLKDVNLKPLNMKQYNWDVDARFAHKEYEVQDPREAQLHIKLRIRENAEDLLTGKGTLESSAALVRDGLLLGILNQAHNDEKDRSYQKEFVPFDSLEPFSRFKPKGSGPSFEIPIIVIKR